MFNRTVPTFNRTDIGYISQGPSHRLVVSLVDFLDNTSHTKFYCDLRTSVFSTKGDKKWWPTQRGVTMPPHVLKDINNALVALPIDAPELKEKESKLIAKVQKYKNNAICLSVVHYENGAKIDVREFMMQDGGYSGFTNKGVRLEYGSRAALSELFMACVNKMEDMKQKATNPEVQKKKEEFEETPF